MFQVFTAGGSEDAICRIADSVITSFAQGPAASSFDLVAGMNTTIITLDSDLSTGLMNVNPSEHAAGEFVDL